MADSNFQSHLKDCAERYEKFSVGMARIEEQLARLHQQYEEQRRSHKSLEEKIYRKINLMYSILIAVATAVIIFHPKVADIIKLFL